MSQLQILIYRVIPTIHPSSCRHHRFYCIIALLRYHLSYPSVICGVRITKVYWSLYAEVPRKWTVYCRTQKKKYSQCTYKRNVRALSCNHCCSGKAISITYYECVFVALGIQHAMCMRHIFICGRSAVQYFSTLSHKRQDFRKKL